MYCKNCGSEISKEAYVCPKCGVNLNHQTCNCDRTELDPRMSIIREIFALLGAPLFVRYFGRLSPICAGGATTMDTTLPIIAISRPNTAPLTTSRRC